MQQLCSKSLQVGIRKIAEEISLPPGWTVANQEEDLLRFTFHARDDTYSRWAAHLNDIYVVEDLLHLPQYDPRTSRFCMSDGPVSEPNAGGRFVVCGGLSDPITHDDPTYIINHLKDQFKSVQRRINFIKDIEMAYSVTSQFSDCPPEDAIEEGLRACPVNVSSVGRKTRKRLAEHFGGYLNILRADTDTVENFMPSSWNHDVDTEKVLSNIQMAWDVYVEMRHRGYTRTSVERDFLSEYPIYRVGRFIDQPSQTHSGGDSPSVSRINYDYDANTEYIDTVNNISLTARNDGCWMLQHVETGKQWLVPFGNEANAREELKVTGEEGKPTETLCQILCDIHNIWNENRLPYSCDRAFVHEVEEYMYSGPAWSERMTIYGTSPDETPLSQLFEALPQSMFDGDWRVSFSRNGKIAWLRGATHGSSWNKGIRTVKVEYDQQTYSVSWRDEVVVETTMFSRLLPHIEGIKKHISALLAYNTAVEECMESEEGLEELDGIGARTTENIAAEYVTYNHLQNRDDVTSVTAHTFTGSVADIHQIVNPAVEACDESPPESIICGLENLTLEGCLDT